VRGWLGYSGGEVAEAGALVNGEETGRAVVSGERAGEGMGGTRDLMSGPELSAGERRGGERGGAANRWGRAVRRGAGAGTAGPLGPRKERGGSGRGATWAGNGPAEGGRENVFSFFFFYFSFLFSISIFYFYFLFISFSFGQQLAK
jgi:hypothetical protein